MDGTFKDPGDPLSVLTRAPASAFAKAKPWQGTNPSNDWDNNSKDCRKHKEETAETYFFQGSTYFATGLNVDIGTMAIEKPLFGDFETTNETRNSEVTGETEMKDMEFGEIDFENFESFDNFEPTALTTSKSVGEKKEQMVEISTASSCGTYKFALCEASWFFLKA